MNKQDKEQLESARVLIGQAQSIIESLKDNEQVKYDNMNEGLQATERGQRIEEGIEKMEDAIGIIEDAMNVLDELTN